MNNYKFVIVTIIILLCLMYYMKIQNDLYFDKLCKDVHNEVIFGLDELYVNKDNMNKEDYISKINNIGDKLYKCSIYNDNYDFYYKNVNNNHHKILNTINNKNKKSKNNNNIRIYTHINRDNKK